MKNLSKRSLKSIWHPFSQMKNAELRGIVKAKGVYLYDEEGIEYIDAISSWWTTIHGHAHPYIAEKLYEQAKILEHVIFAGFTHEPAVQISERLLEKLPGNQSKVFFSDNGSTAVEVGLKMAFQYWQNVGAQKTKVIAFNEAYHGDTFGAMAVGDRSAFTEPFFPFLFDVDFVESPALNAEKCLKQIKNLVSNNDVAAIIFEPLVQGAGGMLMYTPEILNEIIKVCKAHEVLVIADEVMTGFYRTGKMFASDYLDFYPDIFCLSKGLTGGVMAMSVTTCTEAIYTAFLSDNFMKKTFFHGHSFTANPLACAVANASFDLLEKEETQQNIQLIISSHKAFLESNVVSLNNKYENIRQQGTILALDLKTIDKGYGSKARDKIYNYFMNKGLLMRPLGNTIYVLPPYCINALELNGIYEAILEFEI